MKDWLAVQCGVRHATLVVPHDIERIPVLRAVIPAKAGIHRAFAVVRAEARSIGLLRRSKMRTASKEMTA